MLFLIDFVAIIDNNVSNLKLKIVGDVIVFYRIVRNKCGNDVETIAGIALKMAQKQVA